MPRGSYKQDKPLLASIEHVATHNYLRALCSQNMLYASPNPGLLVRATATSHRIFTSVTPFTDELFPFRYAHLLFIITRKIHLESVHEIFSKCLVSRENYHLPLQVKLHGQGFQRNASGPKLHRFQLLYQVLQGRRESTPKSGGNTYPEIMFSQLELCITQ